MRKIIRRYLPDPERVRTHPRLQRFGRWLFNSQPMPVIAGNAPEQNFTLPSGVPVYVTYLTVQEKAGQLARLPDIYGRDAPTGTVAQGAGQ